ncbi:hypothetical protein GCM10009813_21880 [Brevibacterium marinum]
MILLEWGDPRSPETGDDEDRQHHEAADGKLVSEEPTSEEGPLADERPGGIAGCGR